MKDIDAACKPFEKGFREELFDKLYDDLSIWYIIQKKHGQSGKSI